MVQFRVDVVVDPRRANEGSKSVEKGLGKIENRADSLRSALKRAFIFLGGGVLLFRSVRILAEFEQSMATVKAVTGATAEEFAGLREEAQRLGITTRFTASQAADAMVKLARAGFTVAESQVAVGKTLLLAQAGGIGLAQAADIAASTLRGFRLEVDQSGRVVDVLTLAANSANTTVGQLGDAIKFVAPVAAGLNIRLEQTTAALGVLSDAGLKATLAGTGLRRVLAELESPSTNTEKILASLGVTADEVRVSQVGLVATLDRLKEAGIDTGLALEIFGQRGGPAFEVLSNNIPRIKEMTAALEDAAGVAKNVADVMDDNLNGALLRAKSAFEGLILELGQVQATGALIGVFEGFAEALRFAARNADRIIAVLEAMAVVLAVKLVVSIAAATTAIGLLTTVAPFVAMGLAVAAVEVGFRGLKKQIEDIQQTFANLVEDAEFVKMGSQIQAARQELNKLTRIQERQGSLSESQRARVEQLTSAIAAQRDEIGRQAVRQRELNVAEEEQKTSVANTLAALDQKAQLLRLNNRESEVQISLQEEIRKLLLADIVPSQETKAGIETRLRLIQSLRDQRNLLNEIKGPQEEFARNQAALNALLNTGAITVDEYREKLAKLRDEQGEDFGDPFKDQIESLREANELLKLRFNAGTIAVEAQRIENDLIRQGVEITDEMRRQIVEQVLLRRELVKQQEDLNEKDREDAALARNRTRLAEAEQRQIENLARRINLTQQLEVAEDRLRAAEKQGLINSAQLATGLEDLKLRGLDASTALGDGFERAFIRIKREAADLAAVGEEIVNVFADQATEALLEFARTGELSFKEFASSILDEITRIIVRLLVMQAISAALGVPGGGGGLPSLFNSPPQGRQEGGTTQPSRSFLVGERGVPEIFTPDRTGAITPLPTEQKAPEVNLQVVNVDDPNMVPSAIEDGLADDQIINVLARHPQKANRLLGNS